MKLRYVISFVSLLLMSGCSSLPDNHALNPPVSRDLQPPSNSNVSESLSSVNRPVEVGQWKITMNSKEINTQSADFFDYNVECKYLGNSKVTNAKIQWGNGIFELKDISYGEGATVGSSFPKDMKQIEFSITSSEESGESYGQTLVFKTGQ